MHWCTHVQINAIWIILYIWLRSVIWIGLDWIQKIWLTSNTALYYHIQRIAEYLPRQVTSLSCCSTSFNWLKSSTWMTFWLSGSVAIPFSSLTSTPLPMPSATSFVSSLLSSAASVCNNMDQAIEFQMIIITRNSHTVCVQVFINKSIDQSINRTILRWPKERNYC